MILQQKVVGHHLYHATVSQVQPQLMAIRVFLLKPREIIIIYYLSDYQIKLTSTAVSLRENIPFQSLTHFQAFKNPTTLWAAVVNPEKRLICLALHHWKPLTLLTPRRNKFLTEWRRMLQKRFAMFFSNLRNNLCSANLQSTDWDKWSSGEPRPLQALSKTCKRQWSAASTSKFSKYFKVQQVLQVLPRSSGFLKYQALMRYTRVSFNIRYPRM